MIVTITAARNNGRAYDDFALYMTVSDHVPRAFEVYRDLPYWVVSVQVANGGLNPS